MATQSEIHLEWEQIQISTVTWSAWFFFMSYWSIYLDEKKLHQHQSYFVKENIWKVQGLVLFVGNANLASQTPLIKWQGTSNQISAGHITMFWGVFIKCNHNLFETKTKCFGFSLSSLHNSVCYFVFPYHREIKGSLNPRKYCLIVAPAWNLWKPTYPWLRQTKII